MLPTLFCLELSQIEKEDMKKSIAFIVAVVVTHFAISAVEHYVSEKDYDSRKDRAEQAMDSFTENTPVYLPETNVTSRLAKKLADAGYSTNQFAGVKVSGEKISDNN